MNKIDWEYWYHNANDFTGEVVFNGKILCYSINGRSATEKEIYNLKYTEKLEDLLNE